MSRRPKTRRRKGTGTITQIGPGQFRAQLPPEYDRESEICRSYAAADRWIYEQLALRRSGKYADGTLGEWVTRWLEVQRSHNSAKTHHRDQQVCNAHILPHLARVRLSEISASVVNNWLAVLDRDGVTAASRHRARSTLRRILRAHDTLDVSWLRRIKTVRVERRESEFLTREEYQRLRQTADTWVEEYPYLGALVRVGVECCTRPGELLGLRWCDYRDGVVSIVQSLDPVTRTPKELKTIRSKRDVPLSTETRRVLGEWRARTPHRYPKQPIFPGRGGVYRSSVNLYHRQWRPLLVAAGITHVTTLYSIRHTGCTLLLSAGASLLAVAKRMGHSNANLILSTYGHVLPSDQQRLVEIMEEI